jgi:hypothetical protein
MAGAEGGLETVTDEKWTCEVPPQNDFVDEGLAHCNQSRFSRCREAEVRVMKGRRFLSVARC